MVQTIKFMDGKLKVVAFDGQSTRLIMGGAGNDVFCLIVGGTREG